MAGTSAPAGSSKGPCRSTRNAPVLPGHSSFEAASNLNVWPKMTNRGRPSGHWTPGFPLSRRAVRGKYSCTFNWSRTRTEQCSIVLRGLVPRIHVFVSAAPRRGWPAQGRPRRNWGRDVPPFFAARFSPDSPAACGEGVGVRGASHLRPPCQTHVRAVPILYHLAEGGSR